METPPVGASGSTRSRGRNLLLGCLGGCGVLALIVVSSCVSFFWWLNRPGELLEPARLRGPETTAYVEWTLRLEDPGTAAFVRELLDSLDRMQERGPGRLPGAVGGILSRYQSRRNEQKLREVFPCVVAWGVLSGTNPDDEIHLVTLSIEKLGNRLVMIDWVLGWFWGRDAETEVVEHGGEKIYHLKEHGSAFFLRSSQIFFTTGIDAATRAVDRLRPDASRPAEATPLDRLLDGLPPGRALRGATTNDHGELGRLLTVLLDRGQAEAFLDLNGDAVRAATLAGGFDEDSTFSAALDVLVDWTDLDAEETRALADALADALSSSLSTTELPVRVAAESRPDGVRFVFEVDDLPRLLERWTERLAERLDER